MGGKMSRNKGSRVERLLRDYLREQGYEAFRVPLSGAAQGFKGDVVASKNGRMITFEVKARASQFESLYSRFPDPKLREAFALRLDDEDTVEAIITNQFPIPYSATLTRATAREARKLRTMQQWLGKADVLAVKGDGKQFLFIVYSDKLNAL